MLNRLKLLSLLIISAVIAAVQGCGSIPLMEEKTDTTQNPEILFGTAHGVNGDGNIVVGESTSREGVRGVRWAINPPTFAALNPSSGWTRSSANDVSENAAITVGYSARGRSERTMSEWIQSAVITEDPRALTNEIDSSEAYGVSRDGNIVVGWIKNAQGNRRAAYVRLSDESVNYLGVLPGGSESVAYGANSDGSVIVGWSDSEDGLRAFRWEKTGSTTGTMRSIGVLSGGSESTAYAVNNDGTVVVGWSALQDLTRRAFRWEKTGSTTGTMRSIGVLSGSRMCEANGVNSDGSVVVGWCDPPEGLRAFRWEKTGSTTGTIRSIGVLPDGNTSKAHAVNNDGTVIVGQSNINEDPLDQRPFRWVKTPGTQTGVMGILPLLP